MFPNDIQSLAECTERIVNVEQRNHWTLLSTSPLKR